MRIGITVPKTLRTMGCSLLVIGGLFVGGCSAPQDAPPAGEMILIAGNRQGVASVTDTSGRRPEIIVSSMRQELLERFDRDMTVSIIPADGDPKAQAAERLELDTRNSTKREKSPENNLVQLSTALSELQASSAEADVLGALDAGGRASATAENKTLYVYDSGVSTAGPLAMQNGILGTGTEISRIVDALRTSGDIPHMEGVVVQWWGLGQVVSPQTELPIWAKTKLKELWTAIIEAGGGSVVFHDDAVVATLPAGTLPDVTPVIFNSVDVNPVSVTIPESQVSFRPETAEFADPQSAEKTLKEIALTLESSSVPTLWVTGCTANPAGASASRMEELSQQRAQTVANVFMGMGMSAALNVQGLGPACPGRVPEVANDSGLADSQAKNRRVLLTSRELSPIKVQD